MILNRFFKYFSVLLITLSIVIFTACSPKEDIPLRVGMNTWPGYEPFILAKEKGFLSDSVKVSRVDSATDVIKAFRSGLIDVACVTLDEAIILQDKSSESIKIITIIDFSTGGDVVIGQNSISSMHELKGKRVGVESSALGSFMISRAVDLTDGLELEDMQIINLGYEHHEKEFLKKNIDAVVTFEPVQTRLLQKGAHILFDSKQIPGEILDVMVVRSKTIQEKNKSLQELVKAWYKSVEYISNNKDESMRTMSEYENITIKEFKIAYSGLKVSSLQENREFFSKSLQDTIIKVQKILVQKNLIGKEISVQALYSDEFIKKVD